MHICKKYPRRFIACFCKHSIWNTSGFWPRVRARALRAPVFLSSVTRQMGAARPLTIAASLLQIHQPKNINLLFTETKASFKPELGPPGAYIFPLGYRGAALVVRWLAVRQARVRISARHPKEVPPTEPTAMKIWRWASANVYE